MLRSALLVFNRKKSSYRMIHNEENWEKNKKLPPPRQHDPKGEAKIKIFFTADEGRALEEAALRLMEKNSDNIGIDVGRNLSDPVQTKDKQ